MRILHLSKFYPPDPGGLEQVVACLAAGAAERGHQVRVVCATGSAWAQDPGKHRTETLESGVVVARLPTHGILWSQPIAPGYLRAARRQADVVYVHRPNPLADLAAALGPARPLVIHHHSDVQRQRAMRWVYGPVARWVARRAQAVVVATDSHLGHAEDIGSEARGSKVRIIPYGVDVARYRPGESPARPEFLPSPSSGAIGLFVGRLVSYKGLDVLLDAVTGTNLSLVIVGDGPLRATLERQIAERRLGDRVVLAGRMSDEAMPGLYQATDYFVLPSTTPAEMFGIVQLEAMACGRPVISTALSTGVRNVNVPEVTGLVVPPGDSVALRGAMETLAGNAGLRARLGEAGRSRVLAQFTVQQMIAAHLELCAELMPRSDS
ncbi:MAG: hypothetical protein AMS18_17090 [Gemmatimonas sp. SG8_17]|nr:MAG: hypothetical protein AMS18_17090 [Gemmatimonas sp. SG8_17]